MATKSASAAGAIGDGAVVIPAKSLILGMAAINAVLLSGYVYLFGWLGLEVVDRGRTQAGLVETVKSNGAGIVRNSEGIARNGAGIARNGDGIDRIETHLIEKSRE